jgi:hypothetical protein
MALAWESCASYPEPLGEIGQILVRLRGEPKKGVGGAETGGYGVAPESVDQGGAFERVDYGDLQDVVVVVDPGGTLPEGVPGPAPVAAALHLGKDGFNRLQLLAVTAGPGGAASFTLSNQRDSAVHIFGSSETGALFEAAVDAKARRSIRVSEVGRYDIYCDEDESLHCVLFVTDRPAWIGSSRSGAFFDDLRPGEYAVTVYPPRLPKWFKRVTVTAGQRATLTAPLTVNNLPQAGK